MISASSNQNATHNINCEHLNNQFETTDIFKICIVRDRSVFMTGGGGGDLNFSMTKIWKPPLKFLWKNDYPTLNILSKNGNPPKSLRNLWKPPIRGLFNPLGK